MMRGSERPDQRSHAKHRDVILARLTAQILRETRDEPSLIQAAERAKHDPEVLSDPVLVNMLQAYVAERQADMRYAKAERERDEARFRTDARVEPARIAKTQEDILKSIAVADYSRLSQAFRRQAAHLNEAEARETYTRIRALITESGEHLPGIRLDDYVEALQRMARRRQELEQHMDDVSERVIRAASVGETVRVARLMHRLSSIHATHPRLLSGERLQDLREDIINATQTREHRAAARELIERERAVANEIKHLSKAVHDFHQTAAYEPHDTDAFHAAERAYRKAVREVEAHDREWLAGFVLELADLLEEWHNPPDETKVKIDQFLRSVRTSLARTRQEIQAIEREAKTGRSKASSPMRSLSPPDDTP